MSDLTSEQRWPTMHRLARDLRAVNAPQWMIDKALQGRYDDYHPNADAMNINELVADARSCGLGSILKRAIDGEWDATKSESDAWANSDEGKAIMAEFPPEMAAKLFGFKS